MHYKYEEYFYIIAVITHTFSILAIWPAHRNNLDLITLTILGERYKLWSSSLWSLLHSPFASLLDPNIRLRILFSNTLSLHSFLNARNHASQPYSTIENVVFLCTLAYTRFFKWIFDGLNFLFIALNEMYILQCLHIHF